MLNEKQSAVLVTQEACAYLRISRPTYVKYLTTGRIRGTKAGKGWRVLKSELDRFLKGDNGDWIIPKSHIEGHIGNPIQKGNAPCPEATPDAYR